MNNYLIVFIDGFPYELIGKFDFLNKFSQKTSLTPGLGYSINIHAEIFAGLSADQIGFFNAWGFDPEKSPFKKLKKIKNVFSAFPDNRYINWLLRNFVKITCAYDSQNIPFQFIDMFAPCGQVIYSKGFPRAKLIPNTITEKDILSVSDEDRYLSAMEEVKTEKEIFLFLTQIDTLAHKFGLDSGEYDNYVKQLNQWLNNLYDEFRSRCPQGDVIILSDHGMSRVKRAIRMDLETKLSKKELRGLAFFLDTTMLRIWYIDKGIKRLVEPLLNNQDYGRLLSEEERINFGVSDKKWADSIFLLNEGCVFDPSSLEKGHALAMHGYDPGLSWQKGIFIYSGEKSLIRQNTITALECYGLLKQILQNEKI